MKACSKCGERKPIVKFYPCPTEPDGFMPACKACRNGVTEANRRRSAEVRDRLPCEPTEDEIEAACAAIRSGWSALKTAARKRKAVSL